MQKFEYIQPNSTGEATRFLAANADEALVIGGGTAAIVLLQMDILRPRYVVDIGRIAELQTPPSINGSGLEIGALTTIRTLERSAAVREAFGPLAEAASQVGNVRVRNSATIGGSISYGEPETDTPPMLIALDAKVNVANTTGARVVPLAEFFRGPYETVLEPGELVTSVSIPPLGEHAGGCHMKFTIGSPENKPVANVSALLRLDPASGRCTDARVVMGAVGPVPMISEAISRLQEELPTDALLAEIATRASEEVDPQDDVRGPIWYKRRIVRVLVERALKCALERATAGR